jgi:hypothetical protein
MRGKGDRMKAIDIISQIERIATEGGLPGLLIDGRMFWMHAAHRVEHPEPRLDHKAIEAAFANVPKIDEDDFTSTRVDPGRMTIVGEFIIDDTSEEASLMIVSFDPEHVAAVVGEVELE